MSFFRGLWRPKPDWAVALKTALATAAEDELMQDVPFFCGGVVCQSADNGDAFPGRDFWREYILLPHHNATARIRRLPEDVLGTIGGRDVLMVKMMVAATGRLMDAHGFAAARPCAVAAFHRSILEDTIRVLPRRPAVWTPARSRRLLVGWYNATAGTFDFGIAERLGNYILVHVYAGDEPAEQHRRRGPSSAALQPASGPGSSERFLRLAAQRAYAVGGETVDAYVATRQTIGSRDPFAAFAHMVMAVRDAGVYAGQTTVGNGDAHDHLVEAALHNRSLRWIYGHL